MQTTKPATHWVLIESNFGSLKVEAFDSKDKAREFIDLRGALNKRTALFDSFNLLSVCLRAYGKTTIDYLFVQVDDEENETNKVTATHWVIGRYNHSQNVHIVAFADEENAREWEQTATRKYDQALFVYEEWVLKLICDNYNLNYTNYLTF